MLHAVGYDCSWLWMLFMLDLIIPFFAVACNMAIQAALVLQHAC